MCRRFKEFFSFTRKELNGLLVLCLLLLIILVISFIASLLPAHRVFKADEFKKEIAQFNASEVKRSSYRRFNYGDQFRGRATSPVYFKFNPNGLSEEGWQRLGLTKRQISVIMNYESKGGFFRKKEDLKKIYSISAETYLRLEPYINIPEGAESRSVESEKHFRSNERFKQSAVVVEINSADSALLETVRGIGPVLASRIVKYRTRLGGFNNIEQLHEVYGIDSLRYLSLEKQFIVNAGAIVKININTATFDDLKGSPYLSYKQMNAILKYRKQHGPYTSLADLKKIAILNEEILRKIAPYLIFND